MLTLAFLLVVPGAALVLALYGRRLPTTLVETATLAVAASIAGLVAVASFLGFVGALRFASTGAPVFEAALAAVVGGLVLLAWRRAPIRDTARPAPAGAARPP